jgi:tetratricopeptide (TPR) repeat protein
MWHEKHPELVLKARVRRDKSTEKYSYSEKGDIGHQPNPDDLEEMISLLKTAKERIHEDDPLFPGILCELGDRLDRRFNQSENLDDLNEAITLMREGINRIPDDDSNKTGRLANLGNCLRTRFERLGDLADLDESLAHKQAAVDRISDGHPDKHILLSNLGNSFQSRYKRLGNIINIDNAIARKQAAVDLMPDGHFHQPASLNNLGNSFLARFERFENSPDLEDAIRCHQAAIELAPNDHPFKSMFEASLGASLQARFDYFGNLADIDNAILHQKAAVDLTPDDHFDKCDRFTSLGRSFVGRFRRSGDLEDIDNAIAQHKKAVNLVPSNHPFKSRFSSNLADSLKARFDHFGNLTDINEAILHQKAAVGFTLDNDPHKCHYLSSLGWYHITRFSLEPQLEDIETAISYLSTSALSKVGSPSIRFRGALGWIVAATSLHHESLLAAYECALGIMPLMAWLGLPLRDRHQSLVEIGEIVRDAAAAAISLEQYDKALEWLEQGRSIVWTQILQLRTPVDDLRDVNPELADRLLKVSHQLDGGSQQNTNLDQDPRSIEEEQRQHRALTTEWESIIAQVRTLPNFEDFLKPRKSSQLMTAARNGPVVVLNIAKERCDALALIAGIEDVIHIPLPDITAERVTELRDGFKDFLYSNGARTRGRQAAKKVENWSDGHDCKEVLEELWNGIVKPVLDSLGFSVGYISWLSHQNTEHILFSLIRIISRESGGV